MVSRALMACNVIDVLDLGQNSNMVAIRFNSDKESVWRDVDMGSAVATGGNTGGNEDDQPIAKFLVPKQPATKPPQAAILRYEASCRAKAKAAAGPAMSTKKAKTIIPWGSRSSSRSRSPKEASNRRQSPQQP